MVVRQQVVDHFGGFDFRSLNLDCYSGTAFDRLLYQKEK
jgi:hypothetical protein